MMISLNGVNDDPRFELADHGGFTGPDISSRLNLGHLQEHSRQWDVILNVRPRSNGLNTWQMRLQVLLDSLIKLVEAQRFVRHAASPSNTSAVQS